MSGLYYLSPSQLITHHRKPHSHLNSLVTQAFSLKMLTLSTNCSLLSLFNMVVHDQREVTFDELFFQIRIGG